MIGKTLSNFYITEQIGEGGMGTVYKATDTYLERTVALKMLHPFLTRDTDYFKRFRNEAHLSAKISHPNVATLFDFQQSDQHHFIVMEYVEGLPLDKVLKLQGRLPAEEAVKITLQILEGLGSAHELGIMHRDLKPGNIMINKRGYVKLMDFGIARLENTARMTQQNNVMGTLEYIAPELVKGAAPTKSADLYAVGVMLYEMLTGHTLYQADSEAALMYQIAHTAPKWQLSEVDRRLTTIVKKLLHRNPAKRYQHTQTVIHDLEKVCGGGKVNTLLLEKALVAEHPDAKVGWIRLRDWSKKLPAISSISWERMSTKRLPFDMDIRIIAVAVGISLLILIVGLIPSSRKTTPEEIQTAGWNDLPTPPEDEMQRINPSFYQQPTSVNTIPIIPFEGEESKRSDPRDTSKRKQEESEASDQSKQHVIKPMENAKAEGKTGAEDRNSSGTASQAQGSEHSGQTSEQEEDNSGQQIEEPSSQTSPSNEAADNRSTSNEVSKQLTTLSFPEQEISAYFTEAISSESNHEGERFLLKTTAPFYYGNHLIVANGAPLRAEIVKLRSSADRKKAFLGIKLISVQAVNGSWLPVDYPEYSNVAKGGVSFEKGRTLNQIKIQANTLTLEIQ